ncbi:MAG: imidazoleglycerol-phosphate dehydratase HisB [Chloroflexi bacterium]|nr:imidazoleglycerol-phosphate dehydratase HisB [Chloroflexota bacterium]
MGERKAVVQRETRETKIGLELNLDGKGEANIATGLGMFDHLLEQVARHGLLDITLEASGNSASDQHHLVEDVALCLGQALGQALGERRGIVRMAHAIVPMDEALALVAMDLSGRGHAVIESDFAGDRVGDLPTTLISHFFQSLAIEGRLNLHARLLAGSNDHHKVEALFKALGRALDGATRLDERLQGQVPSTKGIID